MSTTTAALAPVPADAGARPGLVPRRFAALAGVVAAAVALATGELVAAFVTGAPSPVAAVGAAVIDFAPPGSKEIVVAIFGTNDKPAILLLVTATVLLIGAGLGILGRTRPAAAIAGILALVGVGALASLRLPEAQVTMVLLSAALQAGLGIQVMTMLLASAPLTVGAGDTADGVGTAAGRSRRGFLVRAGIFGGLAVVAGGVGRSLLEGRASQVASVDATIPQAAEPALAPGPESSFAVAYCVGEVIPRDGITLLPSPVHPVLP